MKIFVLLPQGKHPYATDAVWVLADNEAEAIAIAVDNFLKDGYEIEHLIFKVDEVNDICKGIIARQYSCECSDWR